MAKIKKEIEKSTIMAGYVMLVLAIAFGTLIGYVIWG